MNCREMNCRECGSKMYLDDKDYRFKGNYDNYWNCEECQTSCIEEVRFGQSFKEIWHSENNDEVKDYIIKHQLKGREEYGSSTSKGDSVCNANNSSLDGVIKSCNVMCKNQDAKSEKSSIDKDNER